MEGMLNEKCERALHSLFGYGVPSTANVKDKSLLGPTGNGTMVNYVAPWVEMTSDDGLIVPKDGWWAFDVDLSLYRPIFKKDRCTPLCKTST